MTSNDSDSNQSHFDSSERSPANGKMPAYCETTVSRREFIGITAGSLLMGGMLGAAGKPEGKNGIPHRTLGRTGETVSVIGLGGYHLGKQSDPDESIRIIRTGIDEGIDFLQFHKVIRDSDPDRIFAKGGAMEAVMEAQKAGKVRFVGFTGHKSPDVHVKMLATASKHGFSF